MNSRTGTFGSGLPGAAGIPAGIPAEIGVRAIIANLVRQWSGEPLLPDPATPLGSATREFFESSWAEAQDLLGKTRALRVAPETALVPFSFRFELDCRYKRGKPSEGRVELVDGTLSGTIRYRPDLFLALEGEPTVMVFVDSEPNLLNPHYSRQFGVLCLGSLPPGPILLSDLLEHMASILRYQNLALDDPADAEAAWYFATDSGALEGLRDVEPLY